MYSLSKTLLQCFIVEYVYTLYVHNVYAVCMYTAYNHTLYICTYISMYYILKMLFVVPSPLVQISLHDNKILGNESVGDLIIGDPLTLDCTVTAVRGISSLVDIIWTTGSRVVRRVDNITADIESDSAIYTDSFEISSLSAIDNGTEYQCRVVINARQPVYNSIKVTLIFTAGKCVNIISYLNTVW